MRGSKQDVVKSVPLGWKSAARSMQRAADSGPADAEQPSTPAVDVAAVADLAVTTWQAFEAALTPVIGPRGVVALYKRSLYLASTDFPWLRSVHDEVLGPGEFDALRAALMRQRSATAAAAQVALLQSFHSVLNHLIGESLTERLLQAVWDNSFRDLRAQEIPR